MAKFRDGDKDNFVYAEVGGLANRTVAELEMFGGSFDRHGSQNHEPCPCGCCLDF